MQKGGTLFTSCYVQASLGLERVRDDLLQAHGPAHVSELTSEAQQGPPLTRKLGQIKSQAFFALAATGCESKILVGELACPMVHFRAECTCGLLPFVLQHISKSTTA
jgi:hypothetical protein